MEGKREHYVAAGFALLVGSMVLVALLDESQAVGFVGFFGLLGLLAVVHTTRPRRRRRFEPAAPREVLERRLASGEIGCEEYFERDAILRSAPLEAPATRRLTRR